MVHSSQFMNEKVKLISGNSNRPLAHGSMFNYDYKI